MALLVRLGWSEETYDLLALLEADPSPTVLQTYREDHDRLIRRRRWWTAHYGQFAAAIL